MALNANRLKQAVAALENSVAGEVRFAEVHNNPVKERFDES